MDGSPRRPRGVTVIDVAAHAGVSPMTVSRVINRQPGVRPATRTRVEAAIAALHYTPNLIARSLVTVRELRIGVLYSTAGAAFMSDLLAGVFEEASTRRAQLLLCKGEGGGPPSRAAIEGLVASGVGGLLLAPPLGDSTGLRDMLADTGLPLVVVGAVVPDAICVGIDDARAAFDMTRHLIALGHRRLGFVVGNPGQSASGARLDGFRAAVAEDEGIEVTVVQGDFSYASGLIAGEALLAGARPPGAVFASNDDMAAAVVSVAHRRHLDVPGDLSVVGFDDSSAAVTLWPPLTTIHQPVRMLAATAIQRLVEAMAGGVRTGTYRLDHRLVERQSTAGVG